MLNEEGGVEDTFGSHGIVELETAGEGTFWRIDIDSENNCLYACAYYSVGTIITKYHLPDGELCPEFGNSGILIYGPSEGFSGKVNAIIHDGEEGRIMLFGEYNHVDGDKDIFACCLHADDGSFDHTFGVAGWSSLRSATSKDYLSAAVRQSDGKYYVGGYTNLSGDYDFFIGRINPDGSADNAFGINGLLLTHMEGRNFINALALSPQEEILYAAGVLEETDGDAMVVAAYHTGYHTATGKRLPTEAGSSTILFPNPAKEWVRIHTEQPGQHRVRILDMTGKMLFSEILPDGVTELNLEFLLPAVYLMQVTLPDKQIMTCRLLKY